MKKERAALVLDVFSSCISGSKSVREMYRKLPAVNASKYG
jgi:hypothetical protein